MLDVQRISKSFDTTIAVDRVTFHIPEGEIFGLIGPNGSGKTTIIKMIAGLLHPNEGTIFVGGHDASKEPLKAKSLIGFIPDDPSVWPTMTGEEFLYFTGALYGITAEECRTHIPELLSIFQLEDIANQYFEHYSRGNKQKFTILAALLHKPKLLLIDEPIVGLDPTSADIAKKEFKRFAKAGGAVLIATHTLSIAEKIATTIGVLHHGKFRGMGTIAALRSVSGVSRTASLEKIYHALTIKLQ